MQLDNGERAGLLALAAAVAVAAWHVPKAAPRPWESVEIILDQDALDIQGGFIRGIYRTRKECRLTLYPSGLETVGDWTTYRRYYCTRNVKKLVAKLSR